MKRSYFTGSLLLVLGACGGSSQEQPSARDAGSNTETGAVAPGDNGGGDDSGDGSTPYEAVLSGSEVAPNAVRTSASGQANFVLSADGMTLSYNIAFAQGDFVPTAVNLHIGAVGESTAVTHQLSPISNPMMGQVALTVDDQTQITAAKLYVDVQTAAYPNGELRGQIVRPGSKVYVATATGDQELPSVMTAYAAHASFILSPDEGSLIYHVATGATPTDVRLHRAIGAISGPVAYDIPLGTLPLDGTLSIGGGAGTSDTADLESGRFYLNIVTQQNPAGELRGQLVHPGETVFTGVLAGANEVPPVMSGATGGTQFILGSDDSSVRYEAVVNGIIPNAAEIVRGMPGQNGSPMRQLTLDPSGAQGTMDLMPGEVQGLLSGGVYVNIRTPSYVNGELRGQLVKR
jgi:hypothetical protein